MGGGWGWRRSRREGSGGGAAGCRSQQAMWRHFAFGNGGQIETVTEEVEGGGAGLSKMDE